MNTNIFMSTLLYLVLHCSLILSGGRTCKEGFCLVASDNRQFCPHGILYHDTSSHRARCSNICRSRSENLYYFLVDTFNKVFFQVTFLLKLQLYLFIFKKPFESNFSVNWVYLSCHNFLMKTPKLKRCTNAEYRYVLSNTQELT